MKAAIVPEPNKIYCAEVEKPVIGEGEALIKIKYAGICGSDMSLYHGKAKSSPMPIIPGHEFVGELVELKGAAMAKVGDIVSAEPTVGCGVCSACLEGRENCCSSIHIIGIHGDGGFAQYVKVPSRNLVKIEPGRDLQLASMLEPLAVAYHDVRDSGLSVGQTVLIIGSGPIGMLEAMLARKAGASVVAMSEVNDFRIKFAQDAGFVALDGRDPDFFEKALALTPDGLGFDVVFECSGTGIGVNNAIKLAKASGTIMQVGMGSGSPNINIFDITYKEIVMRGLRIHPMKDYKKAAELFNSGVMDEDMKSLVTNVFDIDQVEEAFKYCEEDGEHFKVLLRFPD